MTDVDRNIVAYIPPINRNVMQELDRSLRDTLESFNQTQNNVQQKPAEAPRDISNSVDAVERAANLIGSMAARIRDLEQRVADAEAQRATLLAERDQISARCTLVSEKLAAETERRNLAETLNKEHEAYSQGLADNLDAAQTDIERLTAVIERAFGSIEPAHGT